MNEDLIKYLQEQKAEREAKVQDYLAGKDKVAEIDSQIATLTAEKEAILATLTADSESILAEIDKINGFIDGLMPKEEPVQEEIAEEPVQEEIPVDPVEEPIIYKPAI